MPVHPQCDAGIPRLYLVLILVVAAALLASGIAPRDRLTWWMEVAPVLIAAPVLLATYRRFPLTPLLYVLIAAHALVLILGGAYTYSHVPAGNWLQDLFGLARNPYDKFGHFMQGLVPVLLAREILVRGRYVAGRRMLGFLAVCVTLAISATYELVEWWAGLAMGQDADEFLGLQGDSWDTQSDMFFALVGAVTGLLGLARLQDRQIRALTGSDAIIERTPASASPATRGANSKADGDESQS
jgi:putative membrane protein